MLGSHPIATTPLAAGQSSAPVAPPPPPPPPTPTPTVVILIDVSRYNAFVREYYVNIINNGGNIGHSSVAPLSRFVWRLIKTALWDKLDEIYPFCGQGIAAACVKLKYRETPYLTNHNFTDEDFEEWGPTGGLTPDGATKFLDTNFPATILRDACHLCYIEQLHVTPGTGTETALGVIDSGSGRLWTIGADIGNTDRRAILGDPASQAIITSAYTDWTSFYLTNRESPTILRLFKRTHLKSTDTTPAATTPKPALNIFIAADNDNGVANNFFRNRIRFASIGGAFTQDESVQFYQMVQSLQDSLGRAV